MRLLTAALALALTTPAAAQTKGTALAPDLAKGSNPTEWVKKYIEEGDYVFVAHDDDQVYLVQRSSVKVTPEETVKFWVKGERFSAEHDGTDWVRSSHALWEADCDKDRIRLWAVDTYPKSNLNGERSSEDLGEAEWQALRPNTVGEMIEEEVCDYVIGLLEKASEAKKTEPEIGVWRPAVQPK